MPNSSGTWKTGERVIEKAQYQCLNCKVLGNTTQYDLEVDKLFPYCTVCNLKDNTYKIVPSKR